MKIVKDFINLHNYILNNKQRDTYTILEFLPLVQSFLKQKLCPCRESHLASFLESEQGQKQINVQNKTIMS